MRAPDGALKILHVMRSPVGGLFRHVVDLVRGQIARGHQVGIIADASTGGERAQAILSGLAGDLALGLSRHPMSRQMGLGDVAAWRHVVRCVEATKPDIVHGHGAKGGAYARLSGGPGFIRAYTPHGGTLHYGNSPLGWIYLSLERVLKQRTDLFLFESTYAYDRFRRRIGEPAGLVRVIHNGVSESEFEPIEPSPDRTDLVFVGELRLLKGVDVLIDAIGLLAGRGRRVTATIVGTGPDAAMFAGHARNVDAGDLVRFPGAMPARRAFALGQLLVVPSRAESLPYIVLEGGAAGVPMLATAVGGIPEIFGPLSSRLVAPDNAAALAAAIAAALDNPDVQRTAAEALRARIRARFSVDTMIDQVIAAYRDAIAARGRLMVADGTQHRIKTKLSGR